MSEPLTPKPHLFIIGMGLIGGSIAKAAKQQALFEQIIGFSRSENTASYCIEEQIVDQVSNDITETISNLPDGSVVIIAVPILAITEILSQCKGAKPTITITDVLSSKQYFIGKVTECWGTIPENIVPAHPIAGSEKSGPSSASKDLFLGRHCIVTPCSTTSVEHLSRVIDLWQNIGARIEQMSAQKHDDIFAATSHLPHLLSYNLVNSLAQMPEKYNVFNYAAGGFRDFTRIAASDPTMWHDICIANAPAILQQLRNYQTLLDSLATAIENGDSHLIKQRFTQSQQIRQNYQQDDHSGKDNQQ